MQRSRGGRRNRRGRGGPRGRGRARGDRARGRGGKRANRARRGTPGMKKPRVAFSPETPMLFAPLIQLQVNDNLVLELVVAEDISRPNVLSDPASAASEPSRPQARLPNPRRFLQIVDPTDRFLVWRCPGPLPDRLVDDLTLPMTAGTQPRLDWSVPRQVVVFFGRPIPPVPLFQASNAALVNALFDQHQAFYPQLRIILDRFGRIREGYASQMFHQHYTEHRQYKIVICGQMKRGKSHLVNMLLDFIPICAVSRESCTSAVWRIKFGETPLLRLFRKDEFGRDVEAEEPTELDVGNLNVMRDQINEVSRRFRDRRHSLFAQGYVPRVDIELPLTFLQWITVVDTPGLGELTSDRFLTDAARDYLDTVTVDEVMLCDLVICVTTANESNGFDKEDRKFLKKLKRLISEEKAKRSEGPTVPLANGDLGPSTEFALRDKLMFVVNRFDMLVEEEKGQDYSNIGVAMVPSTPTPTAEPERSGSSSKRSGRRRFPPPPVRGLPPTPPQIVSRTREDIERNVLSHVVAKLEEHFGANWIPSERIMVVSSLKSYFETDSFYESRVLKFRRMVCKCLLESFYFDPNREFLKELIRKSGNMFESAYHSAFNESRAHDMLDQLKSAHSRATKELENFRDDVIYRIRSSLEVDVFDRKEKYIREALEEKFRVVGLGLQRHLKVFQRYYSDLAHEVQTDVVTSCRTAIQQSVSGRIARRRAQLQRDRLSTLRLEVEQEGEGEVDKTTGTYGTMAESWLESFELAHEFQDDELGIGLGTLSGLLAASSILSPLYVPIIAVVAGLKWKDLREEEDGPSWWQLVKGSMGLRTKSTDEMLCRAAWDSLMDLKTEIANDAVDRVRTQLTEILIKRREEELNDMIENLSDGALGSDDVLELLRCEAEARDLLYRYFSEDRLFVNGNLAKLGSQPVQVQEFVETQENPAVLFRLFHHLSCNRPNRNSTILSILQVFRGAKLNTWICVMRQPSHSLVSLLPSMDIKARVSVCFDYLNALDELQKLDLLQCASGVGVSDLVRVERLPEDVTCIGHFPTIEVEEDFSTFRVFQTLVAICSNDDVLSPGSGPSFNDRSSAIGKIRSLAAHFPTTAEAKSPSLSELATKFADVAAEITFRRPFSVWADPSLVVWGCGLEDVLLSLLNVVRSEISVREYPPEYWSGVASNFGPIEFVPYRHCRPLDAKMPEMQFHRVFCDPLFLLEHLEDPSRFDRVEEFDDRHDVYTLGLLLACFALGKRYDSVLPSSLFTAIMMNGWEEELPITLSRLLDSGTTSRDLFAGMDVPEDAYHTARVRALELARECCRLDSLEDRPSLASFELELRLINSTAVCSVMAEKNSEPLSSSASSSLISWLLKHDVRDLSRQDLELFPQEMLLSALILHKLRFHYAHVVERSLLILKRKLKDLDLLSRAEFAWAINSNMLKLQRGVELAPLRALVAGTEGLLSFPVPSDEYLSVSLVVEHDPFVLSIMVGPLRFAWTRESLCIPQLYTSRKVSLVHQLGLLVGAAQIDQFLSDVGEFVQYWNTRMLYHPNPRKKARNVYGNPHQFVEAFLKELFRDRKIEEAIEHCVTRLQSRSPVLYEFRPTAEFRTGIEVEVLVVTFRTHEELDEMVRGWGGASRLLHHCRRDYLVLKSIDRAMWLNWLPTVTTSPISVLPDTELNITVDDATFRPLLTEEGIHCPFLSPYVTSEFIVHKRLFEEESDRGRVEGSITGIRHFRRCFDGVVDV